MKKLFVLLVVAATIVSCKQAPDSTVGTTTFNPYSDSTKPHWIKIYLYPCASNPVSYADITVEHELLGRLYPGQFLVAYVDVGTYRVTAMPDVGRPMTYEINVSSDNGKQYFNCFY